MTVREISPFKGKMLSVVLTGGRLKEDMKIYIHSDVASEYGIFVGMEISEERADELIYRNDLHRARERALFLMESRDHSYSELFDKLEKNFPEEICFEVCKRLAELGIIDDRRYAQKLCRQLIDVKKLGFYRVRQEMRMKGIPSDIIEETTEEFFEEEDSFSRLKALVEQKYERCLTDRKGVNKVKNALARKGYSFDDINRVIDLYEPELDE